MLQVYLGQLALHRRPRELEGLLKCPTLRRIIDRLLNKPKLVEQLRPRLPPERDCPGVGNLFRGIDPPVRLGYPDGVIPVVVCAVHVDCRLPILSLDVVPLCLLELVLTLKLLRKVKVRLRQQVLAVLGYEANHVVVVPVLLVHVDGEIRLRNHQIQLLRLLDATSRLKLLCLRNIQLTHLVLCHVRGGDLVRLVPLVVPAVHLNRPLRLPRPQPVPLCLVQVLGILEMLSNHLVEALSNILLLRVDNLHSLGPLLRLDGSLNRLDVLIRLNKVVDRCVKLLLLHKEHSPVVLQRNNLSGELPPSEVNCPPVGIAPAIRLKSPLGDV
mmetsp:Transcript_2861/g.6483  ORF Transcript_2861/g.6483 Transcript_2861/m.6483 type:complete len:327 (-) Transcript_2861:2634-3614(-)